MANFPIPEKALESHIALLGKTGSGKTTAAKGMVENVLDAGGRACAIDPTGVWHGLRSNASGKGAGYSVVIFGGPHGDVPLGPHHGEAIAEIIGTSSTSAVIDTSAMRVGERTRFFTDFGDTLIRKNKGPLHLIIDEAHLFMPQGRVADPMSGQMLHAANNLVSLGRSRGLRITIISQRPAKVHKDSLTQVETLVAMRLIAPQDRRAVEDWIADNADQAKGKEIIASLATLKTGDAWIWAPEIGVLDRIHFPKNRTFDSSRAPDGDESGIVLAPINLQSVHARLGAIEAEAKANDPKALRSEIASLKAQLAKAPKETVIANKADMDRAHALGHTEGYTQGWHDGQKAGFDRGVTSARAIMQLALNQKIEFIEGAPPKRVPASTTRPALPPRPAVVAKHASPQVNGHISPSARKILDVIHSAYPVSLSYPAAAARASISKRSSQYREYQKQVAASGEVEEIDGRLRSLPEYASPLSIAGDPVDAWAGRLPPSYGNMLRAIAKHAPLAKQAIAELAGVSVTSSGLGAGLAELAALELIEKTNAGEYQLHSNLRDT